MYKILITLALLLVFGSSGYMSVSGLMAVFAGSGIWIVFCLGIGFELGKILTATYLHRQWFGLSWVARAAYALVIVALCALTSLEVTGYLCQRYAGFAQERETFEIRLSSLAQEKNLLAQEKNLLQSQIRVIDDTLAGLPVGYVTRRIVERKAAGYDLKQKCLLEIARKEAEVMREEALVRGRIAEDKTFTAPIYAAAGLLGLDRARTAGWLILALVLVLEPLSIGLAIACSTVWMKPGQKALRHKETKAEASEKKSRCEELNELRRKHNWKAEDIARITGHKQKRILKWLRGEVAPPFNALELLRKAEGARSRDSPLRLIRAGVAVLK